MKIIKGLRAAIKRSREISNCIYGNWPMEWNLKPLDSEDLQFLPLDELEEDHPYAAITKTIRHQEKRLDKLFDTQYKILEERRAEQQGYTNAWTLELKIEVQKRDGYKCQFCGVERSKAQKLHVHHIDYDKHNNQLSNLISLCPGCHMTTNHNRPYWEGLFKDMVID